MVIGLAAALAVSGTGTPNAGGGPAPTNVLQLDDGDFELTTGFNQGKTGEGGEGGQVMTSGTQAPVLGNETAIADNSTLPSQKGISQAKSDGQTGITALEKSDVAKNVKPETRPSDAVTSESITERYRGLIEQYFKAITK